MFSRDPETKKMFPYLYKGNTAIAKITPRYSVKMPPKRKKRLFFNF